MNNQPISKLYHAYLLKIEDDDFLNKLLEENYEEKKESVGALIEDFVNSWDCDGPAKIYGSRSFLRRYIWAILWFFMLGYGSYSCYKNYVEYQKHEKTVSIDVIDQDSVEFPAVSFCTLNPFSPESEDWYLQSPTWNIFWDLQKNYSTSKKAVNCNEFAYSDQVSLKSDEVDNITGVAETALADVSSETETESVAHIVDSTPNVAFSEPLDETTESGSSLASIYSATEHKITNYVGISTSEVPDAEANISNSENTPTAFFSFTETGTTRNRSPSVEPLLEAETYLSGNDSTSTEPLPEAETDESGKVSTSNAPLFEAETDVSGNDSTSVEPLLGAETHVSGSDSTSTEPLLEAETDVSGKVSTSTEPLLEAESDVSGKVSTSPEPLLEAETDVSGKVSTSTAPLLEAETDVSGNDITSVEPLLEAETHVSGNDSTSTEPLLDAETDVSGDESTSTQAMNAATLVRRRRSIRNDWDRYFSLTMFPGSRYLELGQKRSRRAVSLLQESRVFPYVSSHEMLNARINCSALFQRLLYQYNVINGFDQPSTLKIGDTSNCQNITYFISKEKLWEEPICYAPIVEDMYGYYTTDAQACNPVLKQNVSSSTSQICSTCCPQNELLCSSSKEYNAFADDVFNHQLSSDELKLLVNRSQTSDGSDVTDKFALSQSDIESSAAPIYKIILTCSFDESSCSTKDFQQWNNERFGRCYTFNSLFKFNQSSIASTKANVRQTRRIGPKNGLRLTLDIKSDNIIDLLSPEIGLRVIFHKPNTMPFPENEGINILPGITTSIQISISEIKRLGPPCGKCANVDWKPVYNYTTAACQRLCLEQQYRSQCSCYLGFGPAYSNLTTPTNLQQCSIFNVTQKFCMDEVLFKYNQRNLNCDCPLSCDEWTFNPSVTSSMTNKKFYELIQNIKGITVANDICSGSSNSTIRLQVYLDALANSLLQEKEALTLETFLSNIGGTIGLFIGVSILSGFELVELFFNIFWLYIRKWTGKCKKEKKKQINPSHVYIIRDQQERAVFTFPWANQKQMIGAFNCSQDDASKLVSEKSNKAKSAALKMFSLEDFVINTPDHIE